MANDTRYGLATAIWTGNAARAHRVAAAHRGRHYLGQLLVPARSQDALRRFQAIGHRP